MKIDISDIVKINGASLDVETSGKMGDFEGYEFKHPFSFSGKLVNLSGIIRLSGNLITGYTVKCYRCLKDVEGKLDISIEEDFLSSKVDNRDKEAYTYEGDYIELDKAFEDNILLNLPMKQICKEECKGLCPGCGCSLDEKKCECNNEESINPQFERLKNFFNN